MQASFQAPLRTLGDRNYEVFWGETKEKRAFADRHVSTQAYIDYMRPRCVELARVLKKTGSFYYHCDWHASHYVTVQRVSPPQPSASRNCAAMASSSMLSRPVSRRTVRPLVRSRY